MLKIYRSSAGSGKTFTLVKEYLRICILSKDAQKYKHILAITFTNKAANEMKERILHTLDDFASGTKNEQQIFEILKKETGAKEEEIITLSKAMLHNILQDYSSFAISTIDSFIHKIIRSFTYELEIPHNFEVHMDNEEQLDMIVQNLMNEINDDANNYLAQALIQLSEEKIDDGKTWNIENVIRDFAKSMRTEESLPYLIKLRDIDFQQIHEVEKRLKVFQKEYEKKLNEIGKKGLSLIEKSDLILENFAYGKSGVAGHFIKLIEFPNKDATPSARTLTAIELDQWTTKKEKNEIVALVDSIKVDLRNLLVESIDIQTQEEPNYTLANLFLRNVYVYKIADGINKALVKMREDENILPINEFQTLISSIVSHQDAPIIYERLGEKYDSILIDEFQDTSLLQFRNLLPLIENSQYKSETSLIVGDAKQSIYRFKGGEAEQLVALPQIYGSEGNQLLLERQVAINNYPTEELVLNKNFRSRKNIIEFNNAFYEKMKEIDPYIEQIYANQAQEFDPKKEGGYVCIEGLETEDDEEDKKLEKILAILEDSKSKGYSAGDVAILVSKNRRGAEIAAHLLENGYEVESNESLLYTASKEASLLIAAMRYIYQSQSPLVRYELLKSIGIANEKEFASLKETLTISNKLYDEIISQKTSTKFDSNEIRLLDLESLAHRLVLLLNLSPTNIFIASFLDIIADYCLKNHSNLNEFLEWWEIEQTKKSIQNSAKPTAVKIMTLHKSKGLQFPIVILPDADDRIKNRGGYVWIEHDDFLGISPVLINLQKDLEKTAYTHLYDIESRKSKIDYLNTMYVGTTRAEDRLYLLYTIQEESKNKIPFNNTLDFIKLYAGEQLENHKLEIGDSDTIKVPKEKKAAERQTIHLSQNIENVATRPELKPMQTQFTNEEAAYGTLLHEMLDVLAKSTIEKAHEKISRLEIDEAIKALLSNDFEYVATHTDLAKYYTDSYTRKSEASIKENDTAIQIPDLVAIEKGTKKATIIDFKTGKEEAKHKAQIKNYAQLLSSNNFEIIELILVYTQTKNIVIV